jgi:hypothetical protein
MGMMVLLPQGSASEFDTLTLGFPTRLFFESTLRAIVSEGGLNNLVADVWHGMAPGFNVRPPFVDGNISAQV